MPAMSRTSIQSFGSGDARAARIKREGEQRCTDAGGVCYPALAGYFGAEITNLCAELADLTGESQQAQEGERITVVDILGVPTPVLWSRDDGWRSDELSGIELHCVWFNGRWAEAEELLTADLLETTRERVEQGEHEREAA